MKRRGYVCRVAASFNKVQQQRPFGAGQLNLRFGCRCVAHQSMSNVDTFKELARKATEKLDEHHNAPDIIPFAAQMVEIAKGDPDNRFLYSKAIIDFWEQNGIEHQVIEFCCHALRWQELKSYFNQQQQEAKAIEDWRAWQCLEHILESFEPEWEDATDFYSEYFGN